MLAIIGKEEMNTKQKQQQANTNGGLTPGHVFRQVFRSSFRTAQFSSNFLRSKTGQNGGKNGANCENCEFDSFLVGDRRLFKHKNGHTLASDQILKPLFATEMAYSLIGCDQKCKQGELEFKLSHSRALESQNGKSDEGNTNVSNGNTEFLQKISSSSSTVRNDRQIDDTFSDTESVMSTARSKSSKSRNATPSNFETPVSYASTNSAHSNVLSVIKLPTRKKFPTKKKARVWASLERNSLEIKCLPPKRFSSRISTTRGEKNKINIRQQVDQLRNANSSKMSGSTHSEENPDETTMNIYNMMMGSGKTLFKFCLSRLYAIDYIPGDKEFSLWFFNPNSDESYDCSAPAKEVEEENCSDSDDEGQKRSRKQPGTNVSTNQELEDLDFLFIVIKLKSNRTIEAQEWVASVKTAIENQARFLENLAQNRLNEQERFGVKQEMMDQVDDFLRLAVDLWGLIKDDKPEETAKAQEELAKWLSRRNEEEESLFWHDSAEALRNSRREAVRETILSEISL